MLVSDVEIEWAPINIKERIHNIRFRLKQQRLLFTGLNINEEMSMNM
jgi:hypothetical protein